MNRVSVNQSTRVQLRPWKTCPAESCQTSMAVSGIVPPRPGESASSLGSNLPSPTSAHVRMSFSFDPRIASVTFPSATVETLTRLARPMETEPSPTFTGSMIFPGLGPSLVWRFHTCTSPLSHRKATVSFVEEKEAWTGVLAEGRTNLNDDIGGGVFWERKGVKSTLTSRIGNVRGFEG